MLCSGGLDNGISAIYLFGLLGMAGVRDSGVCNRRRGDVRVCSDDKEGVKRMTDEWAHVFESMRIDTEKLDEIFQEIKEIVRIVGEEIVKTFHVLQDVMESLEELKKRGVFNIVPTAWKKKEERNWRLAVKLANAARFSQYRKRSLRWTVKQRTRPRSRECGPPQKRRAAIHRKRSQSKMKHKQPMPCYYGKNIAQNVQRRFFKRKTLEAEWKQCVDALPDERRLYEAEKRTERL